MNLVGFSKRPVLETRQTKKPRAIGGASLNDLFETKQLSVAYQTQPILSRLCRTTRRPPEPGLP